MSLLDLYYDGEITALYHFSDLQTLLRRGHISEGALTAWLINGQFTIQFDEFMQGLNIFYNSPKRLKLDRANFRRLVSILDHSPMDRKEVIAVLEMWKSRIDTNEPRMISTYWVRYSTFEWLVKTFAESAELAEWRNRFGFSRKQIWDRLYEFDTPSWANLVNPDGKQPQRSLIGVINNNEESFNTEVRFHDTTPQRLAQSNLLALIKGGAWDVIGKYVFHPNLFHVVMEYFQEGVISEWSLVQFFWTFVSNFTATPKNVIGLSYLPYQIRRWLNRNMTGDFKGVNVRSADEYNPLPLDGNDLTFLIGVPGLENDGVVHEIDQTYKYNPQSLNPETIQAVGRWSIVRFLERLTGGRLPFANFWKQSYVLHDNVDLLKHLHQLAGKPAINTEDYVHVLQHYHKSPRCLNWLLDQRLLTIDEQTDRETLMLLRSSIILPKVGSTGRVIDIFDLHPLAISMFRNIDLNLRRWLFQGINPAETSQLIIHWLMK